MISPTLITAPDPVVTVAEAKARTRIDHDADDEMLADIIAEATAYLDGWSGILGRALGEQTWEIALDKFPVKEIRLPLGPVLSVTSVKYTDPDGLEQTVDPADYEVDDRPVEGWVVPTAEWPTLMDTINAVRVRWVAGSSDLTRIKRLILVLTTHYYDNRDAPLPDLSALAGPLRRVGI